MEKYGEHGNVVTVHAYVISKWKNKSEKKMFI